MKYSALLAALMTVVLTACSGPSDQGPPLALQQPAQAAPQQYAQAPAPVVVQSAPAGGHDTSDMLMAGAVGYMLGGGSNHTTTVVHQVAPSYTYRRASSFSSLRRMSSFGRSSGFSFRRR